MNIGTIKNTRTIVHTKIKRIFDVSAVSFPANENTSIFARSGNSGMIEQMLKKLQSQGQKKKSLITKIKITEELK